MTSTSGTTKTQWPVKHVAMNKKLCPKSIVLRMETAYQIIFNDCPPRHRSAKFKDCVLPLYVNKSN